MPAKCTKQQGTILFIMLVILVIGFAAILVNSLTSSRVKNLRQANTTAALAQAKAALIGYAITYGDTHSNQVPGYLPCPDYVGGNPEGSAEPVCGAQDVSAIGRLPWATLDVSDLRDGNGECLWYAVSGTYKNNPPTGLMNWDTNGQFQVYSADGTLLASQVIAVIIAPGAPQSGQDRSGSGAPVCGGNYTASNYLDSDGTINNATVSSTALATSTFRLGTASGINDQMVFITRDDIWNAVLKRADFQPRNPANTAPNPNNPLMNLTKQVALCIAYYGHYNNTGYGIGGGWSAGFSNKSLPWPAPLVLGTNQLSDYAVNANYADSASLYAGRAPYNVSTSKSTSSNTLGSNLMTSTGSCASWPSSLDLWWNNWKDHLFYALSSKFRPSGSDHAQSCGSCVEVNGSNNAAVVMFAGPSLPALSQDRTDKSIVTKYLETPNGTNFSGANGNEHYVSGAASSTFNDTLCYLSESLSVTCP